MIARIRGEVIEILPQSLVVDVAGIGYEVLMSGHDIDKNKLGDKVDLHTYHHVREQAEELYGFMSAAAERLFTQLIGVNGVGPKAALSIIGLGDAQALQNAIANQDSAYISSAPGVGKKIADRICVDLKDKVGLAGLSVGSVAPGDDAQAALVALGYPAGEAAAALAGVDRTLKTEERVKLALKGLNS